MMRLLVKVGYEVNFFGGFCHNNNNNNEALLQNFGFAINSQHTS